MQTFQRTAASTTSGQHDAPWSRLFTLAFTLVGLPLAAIAGAAGGDKTPAEVGEGSTPPSHFHGEWRAHAQGDRHETGLMRISIEHAAGAAAGRGDYVLFAGFCDAAAGAPVTGSHDCELAGTGAAFEAVLMRGRWLVLVFRPTADGAAHTLALRRSGLDLVGEYHHRDGRLAVLLRRME